MYVIDLGSVHGTFVANERLTKDTPVELEAGQSLRFAASTRTYILRKNEEALFSHPPPLSEADLPPIPDPSDEEAVVAYNTLMNQYGIRRPVIPPEPRDPVPAERPAKRVKKARVSFRDQVGGELVEVVGFSDGADVETEKLGPIGVKEGALVGKYESLVQVTVIPKGKEQSAGAKDGGFTAPKGVTGKLQEVLDKVKRGTPKSGLYDDLYGESFVGKVGSSWAYSSVPNKDAQQNSESVKAVNSSSQVNDDDDDDDDLFGD